MTPFAMGPKNGVHDSKRWFIDKKGFLTGQDRENTGRNTGQERN